MVLTGLKLEELILLYNKLTEPSSHTFHADNQKHFFIYVTVM
jgi:hypothetical protein